MCILQLMKVKIQYLKILEYLHLADAFIQSNYSGYTFFVSMCVPWIEPTNFCATVNAMLYHLASGSEFN